MDQHDEDTPYFPDQQTGFDGDVLEDLPEHAPGPPAFPQAVEGFLAVLFLVSGQIAFGSALSPLRTFFTWVIPAAWGSRETGIQCAASLLVLSLLMGYVFLGRRAGAHGSGFISRRPARDIMNGIGYAILAFGLGILATLVFWIAAENFLVAVGWTRHAVEDFLQRSGEKEARTTKQVMSVLGAVMAMGIAPVLEELVFRGMLFRGLRRHMAFWPSAIISATLFTWLHFYILGAPMIFVMALVAAWTVERYKNLIPGIAMHAAWNMRVFLIIVWQALH